MHPRRIWPDDPIFIEIGLHDADVALSLRGEGYTKYLGVSARLECIERIQAAHPVLADHVTFARRRKLALRNNAEVLILSGRQALCWWRFDFVRHAKSVAWRLSFNPLCLWALVGCMYHVLLRRCGWPRIATLRTPNGKSRRLLVSRILRRRLGRRESMHFIPHAPGIRGLFEQFASRQVKYVVLRWFDDLPAIKPGQDVDMLVADDSLKAVLEVLYSQPGIQPCDVYSESGLPRSDYFGTSYYPPPMARRILEGAVSHKNVCCVPSPSHYFHSLAYHSVYHKGRRSGLPCGETGLRPKREPAHDYRGILQKMASELGIDAEISLEGLHAYLQESGWGPSADLIARLAAGCPANRWLQILAQRLAPDVQHQGLCVFALRHEAVRRGFQNAMLQMIRARGFEIMAVKGLSLAEMEAAAARSRGGNWSAGPYKCSGGPPAVAVVAYDRAPIRPSGKQRRKFPQRTNARIFVKEEIRDFVISKLPAGEEFNALHSSDHAAEAWHLVEVLAPELKETIQRRLDPMQPPDEIVAFPEQGQHPPAANVAQRRAA